MRQVNVHAAKTHLSRLIEEVEAGETVILARAGKPVARIVPIEVEPSAGRIGFLKGHVKGADTADHSGSATVDGLLGGYF
ncbi:MAG TPA: type II toxin-antitoxin system Phd/YefM family antitoxin [Ensifer sp.]|nr:type II toxin-antitoxin system Phd/YefM family antitoxin [Ensifer sp.]